MEDENQKAAFLNELLNRTTGRDDSHTLKFSTSKLAYISGVDQKRVEGWLERDNIFLDGILKRPGEKQHRRFSLMDAAVRAPLIERMVDHGVPSGKIASGLVENVLASIANASRKNVWDRARVNLVVATLLGCTMMISFNEEKGEWVFSFVNKYSGLRMLAGEPMEPDTFIVIKVSEIVENTLLRVNEILDKENV